MNNDPKVKITKVARNGLDRLQVFALTKHSVILISNAKTYFQTSTPFMLDCFSLPSIMLSVVMPNVVVLSVVMPNVVMLNVVAP